MWGQTEPSPGEKWAGRDRWRRAECKRSLSVRIHRGAPSEDRNNDNNFEDLTPPKKSCTKKGPFAACFQLGYSQFVRTAA